MLAWVTNVSTSLDHPFKISTKICPFFKKSPLEVIVPKFLDSKVSSNLIWSSHLNSTLVSPNIQLSSSSLHCAALLCLGRTKLQPYLDGWNSAQYSKANTSANKTHTNEFRLQAATVLCHLHSKSFVNCLWMVFDGNYGNLSPIYFTNLNTNSWVSSFSKMMQVENEIM